jgi:hypothetical protein
MLPGDASPITHLFRRKIGLGGFSTLDVRDRVVPGDHIRAGKVAAHAVSLPARTSNEWNERDDCAFSICTKRGTRERVTSLIDFPTFRLIARRRHFPSTLCCDHCRQKLEFCAHYYWRMQFCSCVCMTAYRQRLSPETQQKILQLDVWNAG